LKLPLGLHLRGCSLTRSLPLDVFAGQATCSRHLARSQHKINGGSGLKRSLANLAKHTIAELTVLVKTRLKRMQYRPALLAGFLASSGLEYGPLL
jgi:hypothetical protein